MPVKPTTLLCFIYKTSLFCSFYYLIPTSIFALLCSYLASIPVLCLILNSHLSLSSCHRGKQNTVAMETAQREKRGSLWDFQCGDRSLYMATSCLQAGRWVQPSMNIESFFFFLCETLRDRWSDRHSEKERLRNRRRENEETERKMYGVWPCRYWSLDLAESVLLLLERPALSLLHNTTGSTSLLSCSGYDSHRWKTHWQTFYITVALQTRKNNTQRLNIDQRKNVNWTGCSRLTLNVEHQLWSKCAAAEIRICSIYKLYNLALNMPSHTSPT